MARRGKLKKQKAKEEIVRPVRFRRYYHLMLIVCEDEKTEPYYFEAFANAFPEETVFIRAIGTGKKPRGIVEQAIVERAQLELEARKSLNEVWVVFDKDDEGSNETTLANFDKAWTIANKEHLRIAFSNEVFELWLLLHFAEVSSASSITRTEIYAQLASAIQAIPGNHSFVYVHGKTEVIDLVQQLGNEAMAIKRAEKLLNKHEGKNPIDANPSTTLHLLVTRLRELIEWYSYASD